MSKTITITDEQRQLFFCAILDAKRSVEKTIEFMGCRDSFCDELRERISQYDSLIDVLFIEPA